MQIKVYMFFLISFLTFYILNRCYVFTRENRWYVICSILIFILMLGYALYKYKEVEYLRQQIKRKLKQIRDK